MATAKNAITGDAIKTKPSTDNFRNNYDRIFSKEKPIMENDTRQLTVPSKSVVFVFSEDGIKSIPPLEEAYEDNGPIEDYMIISSGLALKLQDMEFQQELVNSVFEFKEIDDA